MQKQFPAIPRPSFEFKVAFNKLNNKQERLTMLSEPNCSTCITDDEARRSFINRLLSPSPRESLKSEAGQESVIRNPTSLLIQRLQNSSKSKHHLSNSIQLNGDQSLLSSSSSMFDSSVERIQAQNPKTPFKKKINSQNRQNQSFNSFDQRPRTTRSFLLRNGRLNWKVFKKAPVYGKEKFTKISAKHPGNNNYGESKFQKKFNNFVAASNKAIERKSIMMSGIHRSVYSKRVLILEKQKALHPFTSSSMHQNLMMEHIEGHLKMPKSARDHSAAATVGRLRSNRIAQEAMQRQLQRIFSDIKL